MRAASLNTLESRLKALVYRGYQAFASIQPITPQGQALVGVFVDQQQPSTMLRLNRFETRVTRDSRSVGHLECDTICMCRVHRWAGITMVCFRISVFALCRVGPPDGIATTLQVRVRPSS